MLAPGIALQASRKEFWTSTDPAAWSEDQKQLLLGQSPWAQDGYARMEVEKKQRTPPVGYGSDGRPDTGMPDMKPSSQPGGQRSVAFGEKPPPVPNNDPGQPVRFRVLARWESAKPVRLAGAPPLPDLAEQFYVIRLRGLPLMPPPKPRPGETPSDPNAGMLKALKDGSRLERLSKAAILCDHMFTGSGDMSNQILLFFRRDLNPITVGDKLVMLESWFAPFHLSVRFPLKDMLYQGELAL